MKIRVVVADDHPIIREGVTRALSQDQAIEVVAQADNGREALELAERLSPDVMILDLRMPDLSGLVVLDKLGSSRPDVRVIVMTASEETGVLLEAIEAGAIGYLSKRSTGEEVRQAVITAHGGGSVLNPTLTNHVLKELSSSARGERSSIRPLRGRELDVMCLVMQGMTDNEIGKELFISPRTVQNHLTRIREKTGKRRRSELTRWAVEHGIG